MDRGEGGRGEGGRGEGGRGEGGGREGGGREGGGREGGGGGQWQTVELAKKENSKGTERISNGEENEKGDWKKTSTKRCTKGKKDGHT